MSDDGGGDFVETPYIPDIRNMVRRPMFRGGNSGFVPNRFYYN